MQNSQKVYKITTIILAILIAGFCIWLLDKNFTPRGRLTISYNFNREKTPLLKFTSLSESEKTYSEKKWYRRLLASPVEIKINLPRPYKKAKIYLEYQNEAFPIIYLSAPRKTKDFSGEEIQVVENRILDQTSWYRIEDNDKNLVLLQKGKNKCGDETNQSLPEGRTPNGNARKLRDDTGDRPSGRDKNLAYEECLWKYAEDKNPDELFASGNQEKKPWMEYQFENVDDFLKNVSQVIEREKVAAFNYNLISYLKIKNYQPEKKIRTFEKTLRGEHQILTYIKDEALDFTFFYQDLNRKSGPDRFNALVKQGGKIFARYSMRDDGNTSKNNKKSNEKNLEVKKENLPEGFYQIELDINSDLVINKIESRQKYFAFENQMQLFNPKQTLEFYTNATNFNFSPLHKEGLGQGVKIEPTKELDLSANEAGKLEQYDSSSGAPMEPRSSEEETPSQPQTFKIKKIQNYNASLSGINKISIQKSDAKIEFDGLAALDLETLEKFNFANIKSLTALPILNDPDKVDYILSTIYDPPKQISETWKKQEAAFDLTKLDLLSNRPKISFYLHVPGLDRNLGDVKLQKIKITLEKDPWNIEYLKNVLKTKLKKLS